MKHGNRHTHTDMTNIILVLIFLLFCVSRSRFLSLSTRRPLFMTEFQFGGNWKQVWLCFFISGWGGRGHYVSLPGLLLSVGPVPDAWLHRVMSSSILAGFGALCLCLFFCLTPSVHLVHQPGSHSPRLLLTSRAHFISHIVYILQWTERVFTAASRTHMLPISSPESLFRRN